MNTTTRIWRLSPLTAYRNDPRWGSVQHQADVVVRSVSADKARRLASDTLCPGIAHRGGESPWSDPGLTRCAADRGAGWDLQGPEEVLEPLMGHDRPQMPT